MPLQFIKSKPKIPPIERAKELNSKGFSEIEIIDILKKEGYSPAEIDIALTQILKENIEKDTLKRSENIENKSLNITPHPQAITESNPQVLLEPTVETQQQSYTYTTYSHEDYLQYIDYLIQSRISEVTNQIKLIEHKYSEVEKRINEIINQLKEEKSKTLEINNEIFTGISRIETKIKELNSKIEALEEILKEILPLLVESVRNLLALTKK